MGLCASEEAVVPARQRDPTETKVSKELDLQLAADWAAKHKVKKLLLLGAGESGKSTLFKQAKTLYGDGFSDAERLDYVSTIIENIILSMQTLVKQCQLNNRKLLHGAAQASEEILKVVSSEMTTIDPDIGRCIEILWADPNIQDMFAMRSKFQIYDSIRYFCPEITRIARPDYLPTFQDILMARRTTLGVVRSQIIVKNGNHVIPLEFIDVGGQKSQRPKWIHQFSHCDAILFVAAISEYDQTLFEDEKQNRMTEALGLFEFLCQNDDVANVPFIMFLNKRDLFEEKFIKRRIPLTTCFPDYQGGFDFKIATDFIKGKFLEKNRDPYKDIFTHLSCATDTNQAKVVLDALTRSLIERLLEEAGLMK
eukprot:TRINITY_DN68612_c0_g1_i1.p1 TRINITY_DN68612_c0_g1~~TRINITY_DN68612_c0_g1_i1.p1  ORF type:complete len:367 (+),score=83.79 TRINITY_DN68612_c0_g1_i1:31-1131(+)